MIDPAIQNTDFLAFAGIMLVASFAILLAIVICLHLVWLLCISLTAIFFNINKILLKKFSSTFFIKHTILTNIICIMPPYVFMILFYLTTFVVYTALYETVAYR